MSQHAAVAAVVLLVIGAAVAAQQSDSVAASAGLVERILPHRGSEYSHVNIFSAGAGLHSAPPHQMA